MQIGKIKVTFRDLVWIIICLFIALSFIIGITVMDKNTASAILSGASTAVSIVLSLVAILYTMIEGANSSRISQESINRLSNIDLQLKDLTDKLVELKELDKKIKSVVPRLDTTFQELEKSLESNEGFKMDYEIKKDIEYLMNYIYEDIDD